MIQYIRQINLPEYAKISQATVIVTDMGERTINTQVKIDGDIAPDFSFDWEIEFDGDRYIMPLRKPQAEKGNDSLNSKIDLTFYHWAEYELKRYFFFEFSSEESGTAIADKYIASLSLNLTGLKDALNKVLNYYFDGRISIRFDDNFKDDTEKVTVELSYTKIWDILGKIYDNYKVRWDIVSVGVGSCEIILGKESSDISHVFEYGFKNGLLKVERQVQSPEIANILLGRGGTKNIPYRYFKNVDNENKTFKADPDWIPELANIHFSELRDSAFRCYVQGWKAKRYGGTTTREQAAVTWAYDKGYNDDKFHPVEYVKDDDSISEYGEIWGALNNNDNIYPTIQGIVIESLGRIDEVVCVEKIEESEDSESSSGFQQSYTTGLRFVRNIGKDKNETFEVSSEVPFTIHEGMKGNLIPGKFDHITAKVINSEEYVDKLIEVSATYTAREYPNGTEVLPVSALKEGRYVYIGKFTVKNNSKKDIRVVAETERAIIKESPLVEDASNGTFNIWVKNIWGTSIEPEETHTEYANRVWKPILGDYEGGEAKVVFSDGFLSVSEDYEFTIVTLPKYDTSKSYKGVSSHWKITLAKSNSELDATGRMIPNSQINAEAGNHFFLIGIDLPYLYYTEAEKRLTLYKTRELDGVKDIRPTWVVSLDRIRISSQMYDDVRPLIEDIKVGSILHLSDKRFITKKNESGDIIPTSPENLFIQSITYTFREPTSNDAALNPDVEIVLSDKLSVNQTQSSFIEGEIERLSSQITSYGIDIVRKYDSKGLGDNNVLSSLRTIKEIEERALSRENDDMARGKISFYKGIDFGEHGESYVDGIGNANFLTQVVQNLIGSEKFVDGFTGEGWRIWIENALANLTLDKLTVRQTMTVFELLIEKVRSVGGMICVSAANGKVKMVETVLSGNEEYYKLTFEQENTFIQGDLLRCSTFTGGNLKSYWVEVSSADNSSVLIRTSNFSTSIPEEGDECVLMGNTSDVNRQNLILISATEDGQPRIDVLDGVNSTDFTNCLRVKLGNLDGIHDNWFPEDNQPKGNGIYADNAYLKGTFLLTTGEDIKTKFEIAEGNIRSVVESIKNDVTSVPGCIRNPNFTDGIKYWYSESLAAFYTSGTKWIWTNNNILSRKGYKFVSVLNDEGRKVVRIEKSYVRQINSDMVNIPYFEENENGNKEPKMFNVSFVYKCINPGTLQIGFMDVDKTGFEDFEQFFFEKPIEETHEYKTLKHSGLWNGTGDFMIRFTGSINITMIVLEEDKADGISYKYRTLFSQSDRLINLSAAIYDKDETLLEETGLVVTSSLSGLYAIGSDGNLKSFIGAGQEGIKIKAEGNITLEGVVTANDNFKINEDGSIEAKNGKFTGEIECGSGHLGGFVISEDHIGSDIGGFGLSIFNDFFRVGNEYGYVLFGKNVLPGTTGSGFYATGLIENENTGGDKNYGLIINVSGANSNYGVNSNAPMIAPSFIGTQAFVKEVETGIPMGIDFSKNNTVLLYYNDPDYGSVTINLPTESSVAEMFGYSDGVLPSKFATIVTFIVRSNSKNCILKGIYDHDDHISDYTLSPGDSVILLISKADGFKYNIINYTH